MRDFESFLLRQMNIFFVQKITNQRWQFTWALFSWLKMDAVTIFHVRYESGIGKLEFLTLTCCRQITKVPCSPSHSFLSLEQADETCNWSNCNWSDKWSWTISMNQLKQIRARSNGWKCTNIKTSISIWNNIGWPLYLIWVLSHWATREPPWCMRCIKLNFRFYCVRHVLINKMCQRSRYDANHTIHSTVLMLQVSCFGNERLCIRKQPAGHVNLFLMTARMYRIEWKT